MSSTTLTKTESQVYAAIEYAAPNAATYREICEHAFGAYMPESDRLTLRVHIGRIRRKLGVSCIETVKDIGYRAAMEGQP